MMPFIPTLRKGVCESPFSGNTISYSQFYLHICRENFLIMDIYFAALKYQSVEQLQAYDIPMFLSEYQK